MKDQFYIDNGAGTYAVYTLNAKNANLAYLLVANKDASNPATVDIICTTATGNSTVLTVVVGPNETKEFTPNADMLGDISITLSTTVAVFGLLNIVTE